ncbi:hypothetical protein Tco_0598028 [Tanacetum coccineum]
MKTQEDHSNPILALNVDSLKVDLVFIHNTCSEKEESNSKTASSRSVKECSLNSEIKDVHAIKYKMSKAKERCMAYFRSLHSYLQVLSKGDSKDTHIEHGFKREFMSLFGQDVDTFTRTMLLNVDQLQKQLDKDEFQEDGSMTAFLVVNNQFQKFIDSKFILDYDSQMTDAYFVEYTGIEVQHFRDTLLQHLGNVKKYVAERTCHQRQYERRVNKRQMQMQESNIDTGKALDADLVDTKSIRTDSVLRFVIFGIAFWLLKVAFCLLEDLTAFCFKTSLRFASRPHCVLLQDLTAFCFKTSLRFASRPHCVLLQDLIAFCFKLSLRFASTSLRFAQELHCVLLEDHIAF